MEDRNLPDNPAVEYMLNWISEKYEMSLSDLARMFQTTKSTVHYWIKTGNISYKNLAKVRKSFYFLNNTSDPHMNERQCTRCEQWLPADTFRKGKAMCRECEYSRVSRQDAFSGQY